MKRFFAIISAGAAFAVFAAEATYRNPVIWADVPDTALCSDGTNVYMVSTTMHLQPGAPVMKSSDMIHWKTVSYVFDEIADGPRYELEDGRTTYGQGQWAASLRFHAGKFWVWFNCNGEPNKGFLYVADKAEGPWRLHSRPGGWHDSSLFFDDDGRVYMFYGTGELVELTSDLTGEKPDGFRRQIPVRDDEECGLLEGSFAFKKDGWYYLMMISMVYDAPGRIRRQVCYRARSLAGDWEKKVVLEVPFETWGGLGQGQIVQCPDGKWRGLIFQDRGGVGRVPCLMDVFWRDGWPMLGAEDGRSIPNDTTKPYPDLSGIVGSDDFGAKSLSLYWQWNHRPIKDAWSLRKRPGWLRLSTRTTAPNLMLARNTLTQRMTGPECEGVVKLDVSGLRDGDRAGIAAFQSLSGILMVECDARSKRLVMCTEDMILADDRVIERVDSIEKQGVEIKGNIVYLRVQADFRAGRDVAKFSWSTNGKDWREIGEEVPLYFDWTRFFMGTKFALFCYSTKTPGGHADFDFFKYSSTGHEKDKR
jgi:beta-xylosidase